MDREAFFTSMVEVIEDLQDNPEAAEILRDPVAGHQVNLFDVGLLRSLTVMRVLVALEERFDVTVPIGRYGMEAFFTLDSMYEMMTQLVDDGVPRG
jgi:hypothetical protein